MPRRASTSSRSSSRRASAPAAGGRRREPLRAARPRARVRHRAARPRPRAHAPPTRSRAPSRRPRELKNQIKNQRAQENSELASAYFGPPARPWFARPGALARAEALGGARAASRRDRSRSPRSNDAASERPPRRRPRARARLRRRRSGLRARRRRRCAPPRARAARAARASTDDVKASETGAEAEDGSGGLRQLLGLKGASAGDEKAFLNWKIRLQLTKPATWVPLIWGVACGAARRGNFHAPCGTSSATRRRRTASAWSRRTR